MAIYIKAFVLLPLLFVSSYARHKPIDLGFDNDDDSSVGIFDPSPKGLKEFLKHLDGKKKNKKKSKKHDLIFPEFPFPEEEQEKEEAPLDPAVNAKPDFETANLGGWMVHSPNVGVAAMHIQLMPNNKAVWFDTTNLGPSAIQHNPPFCKPVPDRPGETDCFAHAVQYDIESGQVRTLKVCYLLMSMSYFYERNFTQHTHAYICMWISIKKISSSFFFFW